ncbi:MaoC family dehydratase [Kordiimonas sp.]|uniref:MaoC family dehydratase n=1 Tax=Kordiimonas sp. TaxID=1970157 RepID=UPI003A8E3F05
MVAQHFFDDITIGQRESLVTKVTPALVEAFAEVSGDNNPLHLDADYAATTRFGERIAHGALGASFISAVLGTKLPGIGAVFVSQSTKFIAPVRMNDEVEAIAEVTDMIPEKNRVVFATRCMVGDKMVVVGDAIVYVPSRPKA